MKRSISNSKMSPKISRCDCTGLIIWHHSIQRKKSLICFESCFYVHMTKVNPLVWLLCLFNIFYFQWDDIIWLSDFEFCLSGCVYLVPFFSKSRVRFWFSFASVVRLRISLLQKKNIQLIQQIELGMTNRWFVSIRMNFKRKTKNWFDINVRSSVVGINWSSSWLGIN